MGDDFRVLYVDCDPDLADAVAARLQREDVRFSVHTAVDPEEALETIYDDEFDCVVSNHDLRRQDGIAFLRSVRETHPELPFVLFTESGSEAVASEAISAGVTDYVRKDTDDAPYATLADRIVDAVARHRPRPAPRDTGRELSRIAATTDDVLFLFDADWSELRFVNAAYEDVWGGSIADLKRKATSFLELVHPEDREDVIQSMERLSAGESDTLEYRIVRPDGEQRWVRADGNPILDDEGEVVRIAGFVRDITEHREREEEIRKRSNLLDQLFQQVPIHMYLKDEEGRHLRVSEHHTDDPEEYIGKTDREMFPEEVGEETYADDMRVIGTEDPILDKEEYLPLLEEWHLTSKVPWYGENDEVRGLIGVTKGITERKQYERELERQNERLDEFASVVSHELRNPLNVARGRLDLARAETESDHLEDVARAHDRMERLIEDLLELARTGEQVTDVEPVDLETVVNRCWDAVGTTHARLDVRTEQTVRADPPRLTQLFENLFRNAVEHASTAGSGDSSGDGGEHVVVTVGGLDDGAGFYVEDDGPGIPPDIRDRAFDTGYTTTDDGTGFGLSIVSEIVEAHGWEIRITDGTDGGARFEVSGVETGG